MSDRLITITEEIELRPVTDNDREFLLAAYAAGREIELSMVPWDDALKRAFVEHQFDAQTAHYSAEYENARHDVILLSGEPVGRLYVSRSDDTISILDFAVLNEYRGRGIGSAVVGSLIDEARVSNRSVQVYVETFNPSQAFFTSRGFTVKGRDDVNLKLVLSGVQKS